MKYVSRKYPRQAKFYSEVHRCLAIVLISAGYWQGVGGRCRPQPGREECRCDTKTKGEERRGEEKKKEEDTQRGQSDGAKLLHGGVAR